MDTNPVLPTDGYHAMQIVIDTLRGRHDDTDFIAVLDQSAAILRVADVLAGLTVADSVNVGTCVIADLVIGGLDRLYWRSAMMHDLERMFTDRNAAIAAHAHAIAVLEMGSAA